MNDNIQNTQDTNPNILKYILIGVLIAVVLVILIIVILKLVKNNKRKKAEEKVDKTLKESTDKLADKFGGKDNIEKIQKSLSRVTVIVKDLSLVNKDGIKEIFESCMFMGNKIVFVIGSDSEKFKSLLEENFDKIEK